MADISVLGLSGSLRNARFRSGSLSLVTDLQGLQTAAELRAYLTAQTKICANDFLEAGLAEGRPFDEVYKALGKKRAERGLSNSEAATATALWAAHRNGAAISHVALAEHFPPNGAVRHPERLASMLRAATGIIVSSPVYFGDRGSLVQALFEFIAADPKLKRDMDRKVYGGLAVGAKRNGGQETTLIFQMLDMLNMGLHGVGNGHETTAQYGGTAKAGDVGTFAQDEYGLETCLGTGRRVARIARMASLGRSGSRLNDKLSLHLWLVQDAADGSGLRYFEQWQRQLLARNRDVDVKIFNAVAEEVVRCIACEVCPTHLGPRSDYRCIITAADDFFVRHHAELLGADAILIAAYSPENCSRIHSVYQQFIERTRYLRRDNYVFEDLLIAPFVVSEIEARQNLHIRMATSMVRHHTVLSRPIIGLRHGGEMLNAAIVERDSDLFVARARELAIGRCLEAGEGAVYRPVGYEISAAKTREEQLSGLVGEHVRQRTAEQAMRARRRVASH